MRRDRGFTLVEVLVAMLVGTIGLLGTIAIQQAIIAASKNANDAAVAMRLATQKIEELTSRNTDTFAADRAMGLFRLATQPGEPAFWFPLDSNGNSIPEYVDAEGQFLRDAASFARLPTPTELGRYRWRRQWKVQNTGTPGLPYVITVIVTYTNDFGDAKTTRLDVERRKSW
jgi:prepilin-type N-terminal cleavage/methylation domain-containing protein